MFAQMTKNRSREVMFRQVLTERRGLIKAFLLVTALILTALLPNTTSVHINNSTTPTVETQAIETLPLPNETVVVTVEPEVVEIVQEQSTCESEIAKYDWDQSTALAVMYAESTGDPSALNDNPLTFDYSVGCFQINLYGRNALNRPSEQELYDPSINVAYAYRLYTSNGNSFIGQWGVCRSKVACYQLVCSSARNKPMTRTELKSGKSYRYCGSQQAVNPFITSTIHTSTVYVQFAGNTLIIKPINFRTVISVMHISIQ